MEKLTERLLAEIVKIPLIDSHTHIDPRRPTARDLDDLLGYHYYTELLHSAGMPTEAIRSEIPAEERAEAMARLLPRIDNTVSYGWLMEIARSFFGFPHDRIDPTTLSVLSRAAEKQLNAESWEREVFHRSNVEKVFLTNDFDDPLEGFDLDRYVPCLRTDDLVFRIGNPAVVERLRQTSKRDVGNAGGLRDALHAVFVRFIERRAKACAIGLPPDYEPQKIEATTVDPLLRRLLSGAALDAREERTVSLFVFWTLTELCREHHLCFDLMIGANRNIYPAGVHQGRDLFNRLTSLYQYRELFNAFPEVTFPVSVIASDQNQELVAYSWIFPNVVSHGHWWYSNIPSLIEPDARARLEAVPRTKQVGYFSDAYKLEFILPKFNMYRGVLAKILATEFVLGRRWKEEQAVAFAREVLHDNAERIFLTPGRDSAPRKETSR